MFEKDQEYIVDRVDQNSKSRIYKECLQMFFKRQKVGNEQIGTSQKTTSMEPETI